MLVQIVLEPITFLASDKYRKKKQPLIIDMLFRFKAFSHVKEPRKIEKRPTIRHDNHRSHCSLTHTKKMHFETFETTELNF